MIGGIAKIARLPICYTVIERIFPFRVFPVPPLAPMLALVLGGLGLQPGGHSPRRPARLTPRPTSRQAGTSWLS